MRPLAAPLAFVVARGSARGVARPGRRVRRARGSPRRSPRVVGSCWILAAAVVALLNLDAAVVLLTPLYVRTARRPGLDPLMLAFQPVLLAMLASSVLPISNLTNLIVASHFSLTSTQFVGHLLLPSVVACGVGWIVYRMVFRAAADGAPPRVPVDRRALATVALRSRCSSCCSSGVSVSACRPGLRRWPSCVRWRRSHGRSRGGRCRPAPSCSRPRSPSSRVASRPSSARAGERGRRRRARLRYRSGRRERAQQPSRRAALAPPRRAPLARLAAPARAEPRSGPRDHRLAGRACCGRPRPARRGCTWARGRTRASASSSECPRSRRSRCSCGCCEWRDTRVPPSNRARIRREFCWQR